jgi:hypothetical protein
MVGRGELHGDKPFLRSRQLFTALKTHSTKYDNGKGNNNVVTKVVEFGYFVSASSQSHAIVPFKLNEVLMDSSFCISENS